MKRTGLGMLGVIVLILVSPLMAQALVFHHAGITYNDGDGLGSIFFSHDFVASHARLDANYIIFYGFQFGPEAFGTIGFACNDLTSLNITNCNTEQLIITLTTPVGTTLQGRVYAPNMVRPEAVIGADTWNYNQVARSVTFTQDGNETLIIDWAGGTFYTDMKSALQVTSLNYMSFIFFILFIVAALFSGMMFYGVAVDIKTMAAVLVMAGTAGIILFMMGSIMAAFPI